MPRKSPFDMNLSSAERQTLESIARKYTSPYCDVIRAKIILLADEGLSKIPLGADDFVISADENTSIQARRRKQPTLAPAPNRSTRVGHEYFREGAWVYLAAWDDDVIASRLDTPRQIVGKWRKRFSLARLPGHQGWSGPRPVPLCLGRHVHRAEVFGRCELQNDIAPVDRPSVKS
jgi:hypothetical protein